MSGVHQIQNGGNEMTFKNWLLNCSDYSKYGWLTVDVENDKTFPDTDSYIRMQGYLIENNAGEMTKQLFQDAWNEYKQVNCRGDIK